MRFAPDAEPIFAYKGENFQKMKDYLWILVGIAVVVVLIALIVVWVRLRKKRIERLGVKGEKKVARILRPWAMVRNYKVINGLYLPLYDKTTEIDHIVIGFFGLIVIETKNMGGEIYGDARTKEWTHIIGGKKHKMYNPVLQNQAHIECIRHCFAKENIYNINIDNVVVFANNKAQLFLQRDDAVIIKLRQLKKLLHKAKYDKDRDVDVDKLYNALMKYRVTDQALIARHDEDVALMAKKNR